VKTEEARGSGSERRLQRARDKDERGCSRRTFTKRTESPRRVGEPDTIRAQDRHYDVRSPESAIITTDRVPLERDPPLKTTGEA